MKDENQLPPTDFEKRKQEFEKWKKAVGWIKYSQLLTREKSIKMVNIIN